MKKAQFFTLFTLRSNKPVKCGFAIFIFLFQTLSLVKHTHSSIPANPTEPLLNVIKSYVLSIAENHWNAFKDSLKRT